MTKKAGRRPRRTPRRSRTRLPVPMRSNTSDGDDDGPAPPPPPGAARPSVDPRTAAILREERERADRDRAGSRQAAKPVPANLSTLSNGPGGARATAAAERERMGAAAATARLRRADDRDGEPPSRIPAGDRGSMRRDRLPDVDAINASMASPARTAPRRAAERPAARRGGFARGMAWTILVLAVPIAIYALAGPIAALVPAVAPMLTDYVTWVDGLRIALDAQVDALATRIAPDA